jgi:hypothetical protein
MTKYRISGDDVTPDSSVRAEIMLGVLDPSCPDYEAVRAYVRRQIADRFQPEDLETQSIGREDVASMLRGEVPLNLTTVCLASSRLGEDRVDLFPFNGASDEAYGCAADRMEALTSDDVLMGSGARQDKPSDKEFLRRMLLIHLFT